MRLREQMQMTSYIEGIDLKDEEMINIAMNVVNHEKYDLQRQTQYCRNQYVKYRKREETVDNRRNRTYVSFREQRLENQSGVGLDEIDM